MHLRAAMPPLRAARGQMESRIARKVAALSGIPGPEGASDDAGRGRSWFSDYRRLTVVELGLGGPLLSGRTADLSDDSGLFRKQGSRYEFADGDSAASWAPIPSVTLRSYGPDTKAALVLTGANHVLGPVARAIRIGIDDICRQSDDECLLIAVTQTLLQEAFEAQPVLFLHGIQAGLIQRALGLSSLVGDRRGTRHDPAPLARLEFGWAAEEPERSQPDRLGVVYDTWDHLIASDAAPGPPDSAPFGAPEAEVFFRLAFRAGSEFEQDQTFGLGGRPDRRASWVQTLSDLSEYHLTGSGAGSTTSVQISHVDGEARATAMVPRERQIELILARLSSRLLSVSPVGSPAPRQVGLPSLTVARWRRATVLERRAVLLAHYYAIRAAGWLAGMRALHRQRDRLETVHRFGELATAAEQLLDAGDPLALQLVAHGRSYELQYHACQGRFDDDGHRRVVDVLDQLVVAADDGRYSIAGLLEQLRLALGALGTVRYAMRWYGMPHDPGEPDELDRLWGHARRFRAELATDGAEYPDFDHDRAGHLINSSSPQELRAGIALLDGVVLPARRRTDGGGRRRGLRLSLQIYLRGTARLLDEDLVTGDERVRWVAVTRERVDELAGEAAEHTVGPQDSGPDNSVVILLYRIAAARVSVVTASGSVVAREDVAEADEAVSHLAAYTGLDDRAETADRRDRVDDLRVQQTTRLIERWSAWCAANRDAARS